MKKKITLFAYSLSECTSVCGCGLLSFPQFINSTAWQLFIWPKLHLPALISELWKAQTHTCWHEYANNAFCVHQFEVNVSVTQNFSNDQGDDAQQRRALEQRPWPLWCCTAVVLFLLVDTMHLPQSMEAVMDANTASHKESVQQGFSKIWGLWTSYRGEDFPKTPSQRSWLSELRVTLCCELTQMLMLIS